MLGDVAKSWRLPRHVTDAEELAPRTWLVAEAEGSVAVRLAAQVGYDFSFVREVRAAGLSGDIGLKIDAAAKATFGLDVSGRYLVVVGRESDDHRVRVRMFKLARRGAEFGLNLKVGVQGVDTLTPGKVDDFVKAVFGVHGAQVVAALARLDQWTDPETSVGELVAGLANEKALELIEEATGVDPRGGLRGGSRQAHRRHSVVAEAPRPRGERSARHPRWPGRRRGQGVSRDPRRPRQQRRSPAEGRARCPVRRHRIRRDARRARAARAGRSRFAHPARSAPRSPADRRHRCRPARRRRAATLAVGAGQDAEPGRAGRPHLEDRLRQARFVPGREARRVPGSRGWVRRRSTRSARRSTCVLAKRQEIYAKARKALTTRYGAEIAATWQRTTSKTALLDVEIDTAGPAGRKLLSGLLRDGDFDSLLTSTSKAVTFHTAMLTHEVKRKSTLQVTLPKMSFRIEHANTSLAGVSVQEDGGRILLYQLDASDVVTDTRRRYRSSLVVGLSSAVAAGGGGDLRVHRTDRASWSYQLLHARAGMQRGELEMYTRPFLERYMTRSLRRAATLGPVVHRTGSDRGRPAGQRTGSVRRRAVGDAGLDALRGAPRVDAAAGRPARGVESSLAGDPAGAQGHHPVLLPPGPGPAAPECQHGRPDGVGRDSARDLGAARRFETDPRER